MVHDQNAPVFFIFIISYVNLIRVHISEIHLSASFSAYAGGEHDIDSWLFDAVDISTDTFDVR